MFRELFSCREAPRADRHDNPPEDTDSNDGEEGSDMADNAQTAKEVLAAVGGAENVTNLIHCITRLRFSLKDESIPEIDEIKKIPGVIGAQWSGGQFQVIIGQNVTKVYDEVMKLGITGGGSIDIDEGDAAKFEWTPKNVGAAIMNYLSKTMVAMIPIMMGGAFFRVVASMSVMGIPAPVASYAQTVLPIILCMPVLAQVEKLMKRIVPDMLSTVFVPFLTMLVMVPMAYCALAPLGGWLGQGVGTLLFGFGEVGGFFAVAVIGALWSFLVMTGMHQVLILLAITQLMSSGAGDPAVLVGGMAAQSATWGMAFGAFLRLKNREEKMAQLGFALSGIIGGVTEPEIYGTGFKYMRSLAGMVIGGFVGGAIAGIAGVCVYLMGATNFLLVTSFIGDNNPMSFPMGCLALVVGFVVSAAVVYFFGFTKEQLEEDRAAAEAAKAA